MDQTLWFRGSGKLEDFAFRILETPHFNIYYYPAEHDAVVEVGRLAERWYQRLSSEFDFMLEQRQPIVIYGSHPEFAQTNIIPGLLPDGVGGVTEHLRGRVVLPLVPGLGETDHVLGHELVHAFQRQILKANGRSIGMLPLWFIEGMAEYVSIGRIDRNTAMWLRDAVEQNRLPRIDQLGDPRWFPHRYGQALWAYLAERFGEDVVRRCLKSKASGGAVGRLVAVTGVDARTLTKDWHESIWQGAALAATRQGAALAATRQGEAPAVPGRDRSKPLITEKGGGHFNVGPALSPDGKSVMFLSERDQYSIDVFLADAASGAIERKVIQTAGDAHFDSLEFIESAGAWDSAGRRFAIAALSRGRPVMTILDVNGAIIREYQLRQLDQVFSPSWSPDGRTIAFATDRFSSSLERLTFGNYRLATIDVKSGAIEELPGVPDAKNIDPHWSGDGSSLYFISDGGEVSNVYRLDLLTRELFQVTDVGTGVSGITALSPALSVAERTNRLAFSVYHHGAYEIRSLDDDRDIPIEGASLVPASRMSPATSAMPAPAIPVPETPVPASTTPRSTTRHVSRTDVTFRW